MTDDAAISIAKNTTVMMASQAVTWISSFVLMLVLPRHLGSGDYGRLYLAVSLTMIFQIVIDFGGTYFIPKEVARERNGASQLAVHSIILRSILWFLSLCAMLLIAFWAGYSEYVTVLILILGTAKLWEGAGKVLTSCFQGFEMMQYPSRAAIAEKIFVTSLGVAALLLGAHALTIAMLMALSTLLNFFMTARYSRKFLHFSLRVEWEKILSLLKTGAPYFLWSVFAVIYYRVDTVMLSFMTPDAVVGWYGAAYRFFDTLMFLPSIFSWAVFPVLSRLQAASAGNLSSVTCKSIDVMVLTGIPISIAIFAFSRDIISLFFGLAEYQPSILLLKIFSVGLVLVYVDFILGAALFASDRQRLWTVVAFGAMIFNPLVNYLMIPYTQSHFGNGGIGAAVATLITEFGVMAMALCITPKNLLSAARPIVQIKSIAAGLLMAITIFALRSTQLHWIAQAAVGAFVYGSALLLLRALSGPELEFFKSFFSVRNLKSTFYATKEGAT